MSETTKVPQDQLEQYFDRFTKRFLRDDAPESVEVEVVGPDVGDQFVTEGARLIGITYDRKDNSLEFELDSGDHRVLRPREVWTIEEPDGFVSAFQVVHDDGTREIARVHRSD